MELFNEYNVAVMPFYLLIHPFYLAVGIWFERFAFIKGSIVQMILQFLFIGFVALLGVVLFSGFEGQTEQRLFIQANNLEQIGLGYLVSLNFILGAVTALFFGYLGYLRLTERGA